jgi:hypothetical protein
MLNMKYSAERPRIKPPAEYITREPETIDFLGAWQNLK